MVMRGTKSRRPFGHRSGVAPGLRRALAAAVGGASLFLVGMVAAVPAAPAGAAPSVAAAASAPDRGAAQRPSNNGSASSWTVYHGDALGSGVDTSGVTFSPPNAAWTSPVLDGDLFGEPLEATGRVYVATENDTLYALAANTGAILWSTNVGTAVPSTDLACGDITPTVGITGTPVIDTARQEIYAVADELVNGTIAHHLVGLNMYTGALELDQPVDPPGSSPPNELQRTGLNLDDGNVVFGEGGNAGTCYPYHGWVISVPEGGGTPAFYNTTGSTPNGVWGGVWMGGGDPEVDPQGNVWTGTGDSALDEPYDGGDSVVELSPN